MAEVIAASSAESDDVKREAMAVHKQPDLALLLLLLTVVLLPFNVEFVIAHLVEPSDLQHRVSYFLFDFPLGLLTLMMLPRMFRMARGAFGGRASYLTMCTAGLALFIVLAALAEPSMRGAQAALRLVAAIAAGVALASMEPRKRTLVVGAFVGVMCAESILAIVQVIRGTTLGLTALGEYPPLYPFGDQLGAKGTFTHPYLLAGFSLVAATIALALSASRPRRRPWLAATFLLVVPIALTFSRMGALALALVVAVLTLMTRRDRSWLPALVVVILGFSLPAALTYDGWLGRAQGSTDVSNADAITSGRLTNYRQGLDFVTSHPLLGVGPGRYMFELEDHLGVVNKQERAALRPPHNVPLYIAAEAGVAAGLLTIALLVVLALRARDVHLAALAGFVAFLPFVLFDHYPYSTPMGLAFSGIWAGWVVSSMAGYKAPRSPDALPNEDLVG
ncbi:MAG TPA: O-antigen ligase family protein [Actinomycetota bacterium]|nr:O-antigen ligase family protein [Actinomycetota bacterium]